MGISGGGRRIKVKEPIAPEYGLVRPGQLLFTYFHFASSEALTLDNHLGRRVDLLDGRQQFRPHGLILLVRESAVDR